jgi:hypothetical protein
MITADEARGLRRTKAQLALDRIEESNKKRAVHNDRVIRELDLTDSDAKDVCDALRAAKFTVCCFRQEIDEDNDLEPEHSQWRFNITWEKQA